MYLAFYQAKFGTWIDRAIAAHDRGRFSHCELVWPDGEWFSSSWRDGGTRFKRIDASTGHWTYVDVPSTSEFEQRVRAFCVGQLGHAYDMPGVLGFIAPWRRQDPDRWFCSEVCAAALQATHLISQDFAPWRTSPNRLYQHARYNWGSA